MAGPTGSTWFPTFAQLRAALAAAWLVLAALVAARPDLLVLATPLVVVTIWGVWDRPTSEPEYRDRIGGRVLHEGDATTWSCTVETSAGIDAVSFQVEPRPYVELDSFAVVLDPPRSGGTVEPGVAVRPIRWGVRMVGPARLSLTSTWGAFGWESVELPSRTLTTLPGVVAFESAASVPRTSDLVGAYRSTRPGSGSEFRSIREFRVGDRLRRIHWPVSQRTGRLHVTSTWADEDAHVVLLVDATVDLGVSEGVDGRASSLDVTVRATAAIAEHYLHAGDRVELRIIDAIGPRGLRPATGSRQLRRILDTLATVSPGGGRLFDPSGGGALVGAGSVVVLLSPLTSPKALEYADALARRGLSVLTVDTLVDGGAGESADEAQSLAWRIRLLERRRELAAIERTGVPVVRWTGASSLEPALRGLRRQARSPRRVRR